MTNDEALAALGHLIGSRYVPSIKSYISELTQRPRIVGPNEMSTKEYDTTRIHIAADAAGTIVSFHFG
ncbi:MAG: hypothetical protein PW845_25540 [Pseudomonas sp.]|uniref:hypothetical protein n=1 Tax=Pseudomonas abieticivorans TaxID=2931382 RepID=UPI0020C168F8|nr:hypothetical protein [Pseudomonas sp. PIA16]MDE1168652.1 hypothetical protein [Pseudomonas sp.]